eukprot:Amastigsp_a842847_614.p2 type:complete len:395 gc:universal Amastigsp_a842847_614:1441-257(-)
MWHRVERRDVGLEIRVETDECALVANLVAVVRGREHSDQLAVGLDEVALVLDLVRANEQLEAVALQKSLRDVGTKCNADAALRHRAAGIGLRIGPQELAHEPRVRRLALAVDGFDVGKGDAVAGEQPAVHHDDFPAENDAQRERVEQLGEERIEAVVVLGANLALEAVHCVHGFALVVPARHEEMARVRDFARHHREHNLDTERAAVDKVSVEQIRVRLGGKAVQLEDVGKVEELAVDIAADGELGAGRHRDLDKRRLVGEDPPRLFQKTERILSMKLALRFLVRDELDYKLFGDGLAEMRPLVRVLHHHGLPRDRVKGRRCASHLCRGLNRLLELESFHGFFAVPELGFCGRVAGAELEHLFEVRDRGLVVPHAEICRAATVVSFHVVRIETN